MKLNRKLVLFLSLVLSLALATGGTLAYLSDTDADVNTMTLGNVYITQNEQEWNTDNTALQSFTQDKPLLPYVGELGWESNETLGDEYRRFTMENVVDKYVTVTNTGKSDAYVRTIIALEMGEYETIAEYKYNIIGTSTNAANGAEYQFVDTWIWDDAFVAKIGGKNFMVMVATHQKALEPKQTTIPSLLQVYLNKECGNEEVAKVDGNGDGKLNILVLSQAVQTAGFEKAEDALNTAFGKVPANVDTWFSGELEVGSPSNKPYPDGWADNNPPVKGDVIVNTAAELQEALDAAEDGTVIMLGADIEGNVTVTQKAGVKVTIEGANHTFAGVITVDGKSATYTTAGLTIQNVAFKADSISADACIRLGNGDNLTRYTCNVTVDNCTFDVPGAVGVKSYTGGDKNLTIVDCTATEAAHSLVQAKGIDGILVEGCTVNSKNGLNFNNSDNVVVRGCTVDVKGYAVRFGESSGDVGAAETYRIENSSLTSANDDGDATIILRGTADNSTLTIVNTTIVGTPDIANTATGATVK